MLTQDRLKAIVLLMRDSDATLRQSLEQQLLTFSCDELQQLADFSDDGLSLEFDRLKRLRHFGIMEEGLKEILDSGEIPPLEELLIYLTNFLSPEAPVSSIRAKLDELTLAGKIFLNLDSKVLTRGFTFAHFMARDAGFSGRNLPLYHPDFCSLDFVLEQKTSLPIALTCLYIIIGQRLNIPVKAIALPGYFIVAICEKNQKPIYFDPFRGGINMSEANVFDFIERFNIDQPEKCLIPLTEKELFFDLLNHVRFLYKRNDYTAEHDAMKSILKLWKSRTIDNQTPRL